MTLELNFINWLLAISPVIILLLALLVLKWEPSRAGAIAWVSTALIAVYGFGMSPNGLVLANSKGMSVAIYVLLIIWTALLLYNLVDKVKAIKVIGNKISRITHDQSLLVLLMSWCFTSLLQGLAGFGVPVAVVAPIMVAMGFSPLLSVTLCLIGHSWAISFGSMGSSYNSIQLVSGVPGDIIAPQMALLFSIAIFATGFEVIYLYNGKAELKRNFLPVFTTAAVISFTMWLMTHIGVAQVASLISAMMGCVMIAVWSRIRKGQGAKINLQQEEVSPRAQPEAMPFNLAALPYYLVIGITLLMQVAPIKDALKGFYWGLDYPATTTAFGYVVEMAHAYSQIKWFTHPAPILFFSTLVGGLFYILKAGAPKTIFRDATKATIKKALPTSVAICTMVMMALVMGESGMTIMVAEGAAATLGPLYPIISPFIGVLGTFITDSNTNSNVMFGQLQYETGLLIGISGSLLAAAQSVGGSLGVSMAPTTVMMNAANVGIEGKESDIIKNNMKFCLLNAALVGIVVWLVS